MNDLSIERQKINRKFSADGTTYTVSGEFPSALVFIHGVGMNAEVWQSQFNYFSKAYTVIAYDFLGHGDSPMPDENPTLDDYVGQLSRFCKELRLESFSLVGHSMGALISVAFALKYPDKASSLVAINIVYDRTQEDQCRILARAEQVLESGEIGNIEPTLKRWFAGKSSPEEEHKIIRINKWLKAVSPYGYGSAYRLFALSDKAFMNKLSQLQMPVLYLTGNDDPNSTPAMSKKMAELTPRGEFYSIAKEAHMMAYIAPEKVNKIIEAFLNKHSQRND
jgi:pimeloyl-ACP methyl ester carboxylesterase